jgi:tetratricopeptide (TPR) repeat protein
MTSLHGWGHACRGVLLALLTAVAAASPATEESAASSRQILDRATRLHQAGDFAGAVREYEAFLKRHPDVADVRSNLGAAYVSLGLLDKAISQYRRALQLGNASDSTAIRFNLGLAYYKAARLPEATEALSRVLAAKPGHKNATLLLANCHLSEGNDRKVIDLLSPLEAEYGGDRAFAYLLGTALIRAGELQRGQKLIDVVLRDGDSAEAHFMLGTAHLQRGDPPAAAEEFRRALELNPKLPSVNTFLGKSLSQMQRSDEAAECFRRELALNPNDHDANLLLGMHLQKAEQKYDEALLHYERALRARPGSVNARFEIGLVYLQTGRTEEALAMIVGVVNDVPDFLEGHATLARLYYRLGRREEAERHRAIVDALRAERDAKDQAVARPPSR